MPDAVRSTWWLSRVAMALAVPVFALVVLAGYMEQRWPTGGGSFAHWDMRVVLLLVSAACFGAVWLLVSIPLKDRPRTVQAWWTLAAYLLLGLPVVGAAYILGGAEPTAAVLAQLVVVLLVWPGAVLYSLSCTLIQVCID